MNPLVRKAILAKLSTAKSFANKAYQNTESTPVAGELEDCIDYINQVQILIRKEKAS